MDAFSSLTHLNEGSVNAIVVTLVSVLAFTLVSGLDVLVKVFK